MRKKTLPIGFAFFALAVCGLLRNGLAETSLPAQTLRERVICPAITEDDLPDVQGPPGAALIEDIQPERIIVGKAIRPKDTKNPDNGNSVQRIQVLDVLYGSCPEKVITISPPVVPDGDYIFQLVRRDFPDEKASWSLPQYPRVRTIDALNVAAVRALCDARLAYNALSAAFVFVGQEVTDEMKAQWPNGFSDDRQRLIKPIRILAGPDLTKEKFIVVNRSGNWSEQEKKPARLTEPMIYFLGEGVLDRFNDFTVYRPFALLPEEMESRVKAELAKRADYPTAEFIMPSGEKIPYREVIYQGKTADAISFLGSESSGAICLALRTLWQTRTKARPEVIAAIRKETPVSSGKGYHPFQRLVIDALGSMERAEDTGAIDALFRERVNQFLSRRAEAAAPAKPAQYGGYPYPENDASANHSLAWLVMALDPATARKRFGAQLLDLETKVKGGSLQEVQLAEDVCRLRDSIEVKAAFERMKGIEPVRSSAGVRLGGNCDISTVAFSRDGKMFAGAGDRGQIRVWNTVDWSVLCTIPQEVSIEALAFSPDGKYLYAGGGGLGAAVLARFEVATGKLDKRYAGHARGISVMALSPNGQRLVTGSAYDETWRIWDTESGRQVGLPLEARQCYSAAFSPDGKRLALRFSWDSVAFSAADGTGAVEIARGEHLERSFDGGFAFSPDGKTLLISNCGGVAIVSTTPPYNVIAEKELPPDAWFCERKLAVSPAGDYVLVSGLTKGEAIQVLKLPSLELVKRISVPQQANPAVVQIAQIAFAPNGKYFVVTKHYQAGPQFFRADTFEEFFPRDGHNDFVIQTCFSRDGKLIRTFGSDNTVCLWDAATMKLKHRTALPRKGSLLSISDPDGKYVAWREATYEQLDEKAGGQIGAAQIIDADSGEVICSLKLPADRFHNRVYWLNDREAVLATGYHLCRFNYHTGQILSDAEIDNNNFWNGCPGALSEDGKSIVLVIVAGGMMWQREGQIEFVDAMTGAVTKSARFDLAAGGRYIGLVPGGKYFCLCGPGMDIFDRETAKLIAGRTFRDCELLAAAFSPDGSLYAVVECAGIPLNLTRSELEGDLIAEAFGWRGDRDVARGYTAKMDDLDLPSYNPAVQSLVRLHDTLTGRTVFAFPAESRCVEVRFAPDGKSLALTNDEGTVSIWQLPDRRQEVEGMNK
jgi:WD40 repeat protein